LRGLPAGFADRHRLEAMAGLSTPAGRPWRHGARYR